MREELQSSGLDGPGNEGAEGAVDLPQAVKRNVPGRGGRVGRVGRAGRAGGGGGESSLTAGDFVPVPDGSEYIEEKD
jgi:hypothetical protein